MGGWFSDFTLLAAVVGYGVPYAWPALSLTADVAISVVLGFVIGRMTWSLPPMKRVPPWPRILPALLIIFGGTLFLILDLVRHHLPMSLLIVAGGLVLLRERLR
jgi:hypothetical protein